MQADCFGIGRLPKGIAIFLTIALALTVIFLVGLISVVSVEGLMEEKDKYIQRYEELVQDLADKLRSAGLDVTREDLEDSLTSFLSSTLVPEVFDVSLYHLFYHSFVPYSLVSSNSLLLLPCTATSVPDSILGQFVPHPCFSLIFPRCEEIGACRSKVGCAIFHPSCPLTHPALGPKMFGR